MGIKLDQGSSEDGGGAHLQYEGAEAPIDVERALST
jgi:hypothetical protein